MLLSDSPTAARRAGLKYVSTQDRGITRERSGRGFTYRSPAGCTLESAVTLDRIRSLAIPPAWTDVWICTKPRGHIQATGRDARGRRQYKYHPDWTTRRNLAKFDTLHKFGDALPAIRRRIDRDLRLRGLPRDKVAACILHLMDRTLIRIGNNEYARDNHSYGLTTILNRHAHVVGATIRLKFKAKSGSLCDVSIDSRRAARIVRICQELPGQELFCYRDEDGKVRNIGSADVNDYLSRAAGQTFTAKDFRTWGGTCAAVQALQKLGPASTRKPVDRKKIESAAIAAAAEALGNTVAVCRKFYVHPGLFDEYAAGRLSTAFSRAARAPARRLSIGERALLALRLSSYERSTKTT